MSAGPDIRVHGKPSGRQAPNYTASLKHKVKVFDFIKSGGDNLTRADNPENTGKHLRHRLLVRNAMDEAERRAWDAFSRYKFVMGGYHAAQWVMLNKLLEDGRQPNPFANLVKLAREHTVK